MVARKPIVMHVHTDKHFFGAGPAPYSKAKFSSSRTSVLVLTEIHQKSAQKPKPSTVISAFWAWPLLR